MEQPLKVLELFSGIGAASKALTRLGIAHEIVDSVEIDRFAVQSFNAVHGTNFEPQDITKWDKDIEADLIIHGSPCQDFSVAGKQAGGDKDSGTRSSLMYETIRIVAKVNPKYVVWENVKNLLSKKHRHNFDAYLQTMENLGYRNYYQVLNAKNYGIPQNRERVFTISIRNDIKKDFFFPAPVPLERKLKDMLEENVDEKYYISDAMLNYFMGVNQKPSKFPRGERFMANMNRKNQDVANAITTNPGQRPTDNFIRVKTANKQGYDLATAGDGVDLQYPTSNTRRGRVGHGVSKTIMTGGAMGVVVEPNLKTQLCNKLVEEGVVKGGEIVNHSYTTSEQRNTLEKYIESRDGIVPTLTTRPDILGYAENKPPLRIRKLTPKETWRLMGFDDEDVDKAKAAGVSNAQLYKQAGNSIVVDVLEKIFTNLLGE